MAYKAQTALTSWMSKIVATPERAPTHPPFLPTLSATHNGAKVCMWLPNQVASNNGTTQETVAGIPEAEDVQVHSGDGQTFLTIFAITSTPLGGTVELAQPSMDDRLTVGPDDLGSPLSEVYRPQQTLCNEDHLSESSESSLNISSPVISDTGDGPAPGVNESESESSDNEWDDEAKDDLNRGQNLQFWLQAAAAGTDIFPIP